jgi:hypothetical protein
LPLILGIAAEILLTAGGYIGGSLVFVYGVRVLGRPGIPMAHALIPGKATVEEERSAPGAPSGEQASGGPAGSG